MKKKIRKILVLFVIAAFVVTGCGSSAYSASASYENSSYENAKEAAYYVGYDASAAMEEPMDMMDEEMYDTSSTAAYEPGDVPEPYEDKAVSLTNDKLVYSCSIDMESMEYKETVDSIRDLIRSADAIIESESESDSDNRWYYSNHTKTSGTMRLYLTIRVPAAKYEGFVEDLCAIGKVLSKSQNVDNISRQYHDTQARIEALTKEEERLNSMIDLAETIEEMIYIEERLTEVEAQLNSYKTNLAAMDVDVAYSTVHLTLREVMVYTPEVQPTATFGERLVKTFRDSWESFTGFLEGFLFVIIYLLPFVILGAVIAGIIVFIIRKTDKRTPEQRRADRLAKKESKARYKAAMQQAKMQAKSMRRGRPFIPAAGGEMKDADSVTEMEAEHKD